MVVVPFGLVEAEPGAPLKKSGELGSLEAVCDGELDVDWPVLVVVGEPKKIGALGSVDAVCDGDDELDSPLLLVVGEPPKKIGAFGSFEAVGSGKEEPVAPLLGPKIAKLVLWSDGTVPFVPVTVCV